MHSDGKLPKFKAPLVKQLKKGTEIQLVLPNLGTRAGGTTQEEEGLHFPQMGETRRR